MAKRRLSFNSTPIAVPADEVAVTTASQAGNAAAAASSDTKLAAASDGVAPPPPAATDSKQARILVLLRRSEGATIAELMAATGWMSHSVRGTLSAVVKRKLGLTLESCLEADRGRVYRIVPPPVVKPARRGKSKAPASATSARAAA